MIRKYLISFLPAWLSMVLLLIPRGSHAHIFNTSYAFVDLSGSQCQVYIVFDLLELQTYTGLFSSGTEIDDRNTIADSLAQRVLPLLHLSLGGREILLQATATSFEFDDYDNEFIKIHYSGEMPASGWYLSVHLQFFELLGPIHRNFLTVRVPDGQYEAVINARNPEENFNVARGTSLFRVVQAFLEKGVTSALNNYLQLFLLAGFVLTCRKWPAVFKVTLALALSVIFASIAGSQGLVTLPQKLILILISASVVYVAVENIFVRGEDERWLLAIAFGFLHGFGNVAVIHETGIPPDARISALFSYGISVLIFYYILALVFQLISKRLLTGVPAGLVYWSWSGICIVAAAGFLLF